MPRRGRPEKWGISTMKVGDEIILTPKQLTYVRQRFYKFKYKMSYRPLADGRDDIVCTREA